MEETTGWDSPWAVHVIGLLTSLILLVVALAGVKWVVKLQLLLYSCYLFWISWLTLLHIQTMVSRSVGKWQMDIKELENSCIY